MKRSAKGSETKMQEDFMLLFSSATGTITLIESQ